MFFGKFDRLFVNLDTTEFSQRYKICICDSSHEQTKLNLLGWYFVFTCSSLCIFRNIDRTIIYEEFLLDSETMTSMNLDKHDTSVYFNSLLIFFFFLLVRLFVWCFWISNERNILWMKTREYLWISCKRNGESVLWTAWEKSAGYFWRIVCRFLFGLVKDARGCAPAL